MRRTGIPSCSSFRQQGALSRRRFLMPYLYGVAALGLFLGAVGHGWCDAMYWTDFFGGDIRRANLDGTGQQTLVTGLNQPAGIALDLAGGHMYWSNNTLGPGLGDIRRANLDGTDPQIVISGLNGPAVIALDIAGGQMYWSDYSGGDIRRANLDGTGQTTLIKGLTHPGAVALDLAGGRLYWSDHIFAVGNIQRANLDGTGQEILVRGQASPHDLVLDLHGGQMYWTEFGSGTIRRANLDGTGQQTLVRGLVEPISVALDLARGKMYWTNSAGGTIRRANLDGSGQETLITGLAGAGPAVIALDLGVPGTAVFFAVAAPASVSSGTSFDLTVTALDPYGNTDVNYQGTVTFSTSDTDPGIVLPTDYTFTADGAGVHTFPGGVTLITPGDQIVTATDTVSGITGPATVTVGPGP